MTTHLSTKPRPDHGRAWSYTAADQVVGWTYDQAGNLTDDGTQTYTYNALNHMTGATPTGGLTTTYQYNGDGVLVAHTTGSTTTRFTQDLQAPLSQMLEVDDGSTTTQYIYGYERLAEKAGSTHKWPIQGELGNIRAILDNMGLTLSLIEYDPWGQPTGGALPSPFGFTGEYQNGGLVYLRARWYQPGNGRFMVHDPMSGRDRAPKTFHPYQYAWNAPTVHTDPTGWTPPAHHRPFGVAIKGESDCPTWHGTMRALCEEGDLEDATATPEELENALWARLQVDMNVVTFGYARGLGPGTGWQEAADMMAYFLYGGGVHQDIYPDDDFSQDQGVLRGTRGINPADFVEHSAEANLVFPLVHDLIRNHMKASWTDKSSPPVPVTIEALNGVHYKDTNRGAFGKGELPGSYRAHDRGFYSADGRFVMTGEFKYNAMFCADDGGYYMSYGARYSINEPYDWHDGTVTDFGLMKIPHSWHNSLVKAGLANEYDYTVHWSDHQTLFITTDRSQFREASPLMGHLLDELQLTNWANTR